MLVDYMVSQPYWSLIESQNGCLDNSNPNSLIESTVNQFETPSWYIHKKFFFVIHFCC